MDPYQITPAEKARFEQQFAALKPINGIVTGDQAKGFFLQSQLPPAILGVIWGLADTDADGRMNINEFSIACKLISMKLRGFDIPKVLPPSLQTLVSMRVNGTHIIPTKPPVPPQPMVPIGRTTPTAAVTPISRVLSPPSGDASPLTPTAMVQPSVAQIPPTQAYGVSPQPPLIPGQVPLIPGARPVLPQAQPPLVPPPGIVSQPPQIPPITSQPQFVPVLPAQPPVVPPMAGQTPLIPPIMNQPVAAIPPVAIPPSSLAGLNVAQPMTQPVPPVAPLEKAPSIETPLSTTSPLVEWAIPQASRLKYTQLFNTTDRSRTGYLSGVQARNILLASQLPQQILAKIWALADMDSDGRLSCEEFVLALHMCDMARTGESIPASLPPNLIPPTLRKQRNNSLSDSGDSAFSNVTFEDKRKENFEKGQAELERRRKMLLEIQKKEQEERERKEREELGRQEKLRLEQERKRQEEIERQLEKQREIEKAKEEERRRIHEQREAARREMERQRQEEWEKQRIQELQSQLQKQQQNVLASKAHNQTLTRDLSQLNEKSCELSKKISETRCKVTSVKSTIDGMRLTRDEQMANQNRLKALLKQYNQRLVALSQQKAKLEAQGKLTNDANAQEQMRLAFNNKQITINNLKEKNKDLEESVKSKSADLENNNAQIEDLKKDLVSVIEKCEALYSVYDSKRNQVIETRGKRNTSWGDEAWDSAPTQWSAQETSPVQSGYAKYRALYEFVARNSDELSFQPGDIILVSTEGRGEPGWFSGELRGATGWFPESYVEPVASTGQTDSSSLNNAFQQKTPLEDIVEVSESEVEASPPVPCFTDPILGMGEPVSSTATALYNFTPTSDQMLLFYKGDTLNVTEIQGEWAYGEGNGLSGWFPKCYISMNETSTVSTSLPVNNSSTQDGEYYTATYAYQSEEPGDLTFDQGQLILVVAKDGDWWTGTIGSVSGIFPSNYVQKVPSQQQVEPEPTVEPTVMPVVAAEPVVEEPVVVEQKSTPVTLEPQKTGGSSRAITPDMSSTSGTPQPDTGSGEESDTKVKAKKPEIATVIAPYQASSSEQLSLQRNQLIMIRKKTSTGWWEGELQAKGRKRQIGWFPASYVKLIGGGTSSSQAKSPSPMPNRDSTGTDTNTEKVIALYQYSAQNEDELSFEKDDIITVIAREEPAWWKGELKGATGLFPSNYVGPVSKRLSQYDANGNMPYLTKEEEKRQQHIQELILTEQAYIDDMSIVYDVFEKPLIESRLLTNEQIKSIFINWHDILACNYTFLRALRVRRDMNAGNAIRMIGDVLCENIPHMTVYVRFCSCQLSAAATLQSLIEGNKDLRNLARRCQSDPRTRGLPLSSFLIKPMQRITKYPLLISRILDQTPNNHPDHHNLEEALYKAEELCSQVNEGVREKENCERLEWLQTHLLNDGLTEPLIFNSLTNSVGPRKLLHYGVVSKTKSGKELVAFLMNDFLLLALPNRPLGNQFNFEKYHNILLKMYKMPLLLSDMMLLNSPEGADSVEFRLDCNKKIYHLSASTHNERNLWLKKIQQAQRELRQNEKAMFHRQQSIRGRIPKGTLNLFILDGSNLEPCKLNPGRREVFCEVSMGSQEQRTPTITPLMGQDPRWNSSMQFLVKDLRDDVLCITVKDKGHFSPDEFLGRTEIGVSEILKASQKRPGPLQKVLKLHEVHSGEISLKLDLRLFEK